MADNNRKLVVASMALRGAAPHEWDSFCIAMREYAALQVAEMLKVAPEMLPKAQGMALGMQEISKIVNEAPSLFDQIQTGQRRADNGRPAQRATVPFSG